MTRIESKDPVTGEVVWSGTAATAKEIDRAALLAAHAQKEWETTPFTEKCTYLQRYSTLLLECKDDLALTISKETGKVLWDSKSEVQAMVNKITISIAAYEERCKEIKDGAITTRFRPHGTVAVFGPYNFPGHLPNGHIVPALLAGNAILFKPSERTPKTAIMMLELLKASGLPPNLVHILQGAREVGRVLALHPSVNGIFFTGSYAGGRQLKQMTEKMPGKILALEMGGNNPLVVWDADDPEAAAYLIIQSAFLSSGQRCSSARRLILPNNAFGKELTEVILHWMKRIRVGHYSETPEPFMGPVAHPDFADHLLSAQATLIKRGARPLMEMKQLKPGTGLVSAALLDVTSVAARSDEEFFGPLLQLIYVDTFEAALAEANNTGFGLTAGIVCRSEELYRHFYRSIRAGIINWNTQLTGASSKAPFGGLGKSGNFHPSAYLAADYCAYPTASSEIPSLVLPQTLAAGFA